MRSTRPICMSCAATFIVSGVMVTSRGSGSRGYARAGAEDVGHFFDEELLQARPKPEGSVTMLRTLLSANNRTTGAQVTSPNCS